MPRINIIITSYEECKEDLIAFRNANRDSKRDASYFDWRYIERPNEQKPIIVWAETEEGVKIGALSLVPHHYMINNEVAHVGLLGDISVANEWRGKGIAQQMFKYLSESEEAKRLSACLVLPNEDAARPLMKANWRTISTMTRYVKLIDVEKRLRKQLKAPWLSKLIAFVLNAILKATSLETYAGVGHGYNGAVVEEFDHRFDDLWNDTKKDGMVIGVRNKQYLTWRYANHPLVHYQIYTLSGHSRLCGYIVYQSSGSTVYIDDMFSVGGAERQRYLLIYFIKYMRSINASEIIFNVNKNDLLKLRWYRFGLFRRSDNWRIMIHVDESKQNEFLRDGCKWLLTAGDKDV